jgi:hypothetical protein
MGAKKFTTSSRMSARVSMPGMSSMSGSVVGGLKKWMPRNRPRRLTGRAEARSEIDSVLVLEAMTQCSGILSMSSAKIFFFSGAFSGAASTTS